MILRTAPLDRRNNTFIPTVHGNVTTRRLTDHPTSSGRERAVCMLTYGASSQIPEAPLRPSRADRKLTVPKQSDQLRQLQNISPPRYRTSGLREQQMSVAIILYLRIDQPQPEIPERGICGKNQRACGLPLDFATWILRGLV